jgi:thiamine biosynthesis lipoprotein
LATSGNYRNFYIENGKKYAHTIDPRTGEPVLHNLLIATVIAKDCMSADAYATAFMVMGLESSKTFLNKNPDVDAFLIYDENGVFKTYATNNIQTGL